MWALRHHPLTIALAAYVIDQSDGCHDTDQLNNQ
jgi:hypothetical protein